MRVPSRLCSLTPASVLCPCRSSTRTSTPLMVVYGKGSYPLTKDKIGTRYVVIAVRTLVDPNDPKDLDEVHSLQDAIQVSQQGPGKFEIPNWDPVSQKKVREALLVLGTTLPDSKTHVRNRATDRTGPSSHRSRHGLGRQSRKRSDLSQCHAEQERWQNCLSAPGEGRTCRWLLVDQPLQTKKAISKKIPTTPTP